MAELPAGFQLIEDEPQRQSAPVGLPAGFQLVDDAQDQQSPNGGWATRAQRETAAPVSAVEAAGRGISQGMTFGFADELRGLTEAGGTGQNEPASLGGVLKGAYGMLTGDPEAQAAYERATIRRREELAQAREQQPLAAYGGEIAGGVAVPVGAMGQAATRGQAAIQGAKAGAIGGALYGAGQGEDVQGRLTGAATGAAVGGVLGGAIGGALGPSSAAPAVGSGSNDVVSAAERLGVSVPTAIASDSMVAQRAGQAIRNVPVVGNAIPRATQETIDQLGERVGSVAGAYGSGTGPNVANRIGRTIGDAAERETAAARATAQQADDAARAAWETGRQGALNRIAQGERVALQTAQREVGDMNPQDMGAAIIQRLRAGEEAARATKERLYGVASAPGRGAINADSVRTVSSRVAQTLEDAGRPVDDILTPASSRMLTELRRLSNLDLPNRAIGARTPSAGNEVISAVDMNGIEFVRKRLNGLSRAASNDADRSAARAIIREFDSWLDDAFDRALYSGSDDALRAFREARAANASWRQRFGFNARDDADRLINKVVSGEVTPQEMANWLVGSTKVGAQGVSSRLLTRIAEATGDDAAAMGAIRAGVWNRLSQTVQGVDDKASAKTANEIYEFLNGAGRDVARRLFTPQQQGVMRSYADTLRRGTSMREAVADYAKANAPKPTDVGIGPMQDLANAVLGRGGKADEALFSAIDSYARSGSRGDIHTLADVLRAIPSDEKGNLAGAIINNLGVSPRSGQWSPDVFLSQWRSYTPQAKALLFGTTGNHRAALDDIATVAQRLQDVGKRFGNPSGTAQNVNAAGLAYGIFADPVTAISAALGGAAASKILAAPATASSMARWARVYEVAVTKPSAGTAVALQGATRNLASTIGEKLGISVAPEQILRAIAGPRLSPASDGKTDQEKQRYRQ